MQIGEDGVEALIGKIEDVVKEYCDRDSYTMIDTSITAAKVWALGIGIPHIEGSSDELRTLANRLVAIRQKNQKNLPPAIDTVLGGIVRTVSDKITVADEYTRMTTGPMSPATTHG